MDKVTAKKGGNLIRSQPMTPPALTEVVGLFFGESKTLRVELSNSLGGILTSVETREAVRSYIVNTEMPHQHHDFQNAGILHRPVSK